MSYNIYYMYDIAKGTGYIGQNTDANDDKRIVDHYKASIKPKTKKVNGKEKEVYDGGAALIKDAARLSDIRYKFFNDAGYGIPINVYNLFLQEWSLNPDGRIQKWDDLTNEEKLDLAEIMHNLSAHLNGKPWNKYNRLLGGMSYTKDNTTAMKSLTYRFTDEGIDALKDFYKKIGEPNKKIEYTVTRFQAQKTLTSDDFSKIIYPLRYLTGKAFVQKVVLEMLQSWFNNFFKSLLKENRKENSRYQKFRKILIRELGEAVAEKWLIPDEWSNLFENMSGLHSKVVIKNTSLSTKTNREFADFIFEQFDKLILKKEVDTLHNDINFAIRKMIRGTDANWQWQVSREQVRSMISKFFGKLKKMSLKSMSELFTMKYNNLHIDLSEEITIPHQFLVNIEEKYTTLPKWALQLKRTQLLNQWVSPDNGILKTEICKDVCLNLFSQIKDLIPSQYDTSQTLQSRLYDALHRDDWIKSGYSWDFCRTLIDVWHEYTYGGDAWTRKIDTSFYNEKLPDYEKYRFARTDIIEAAENAKTQGRSFLIHWYRGTFYENSGIAKGSLDDAARVLAEKWKW